jgi:hypothetical protein
MDAKVVEINPEEASKILSNAPDYQRNLSKLTVSQYARSMRDGKWMPNSIIQISNGLLVDGQHRLQAIIESGVTIPFVVISHNGGAEVDIERYEVIDQNNPRRFGAIMRIDAHHRDGWKLGDKDKVKLGGAVNIIASGFFKHSVKLSNMEKVDLVFGWQEEYLKYKEVVSIQYDTLFFASPYVSLACVTFRYQPVKAEAFWYGVVTGESDSMERPHAHLRKFLMTSVRSTGGGSAIQVHRTSAAIHCWNNFYADKKMKMLKVPALTTDSKIEGTPY